MRGSGRSGQNRQAEGYGQRGNADLIRFVSRNGESGGRRQKGAVTK